MEQPHGYPRSGWENQGLSTMTGQKETRDKLEVSAHLLFCHFQGQMSVSERKNSNTGEIVSFFFGLLCFHYLNELIVGSL